MVQSQRKMMTKLFLLLSVMPFAHGIFTYTDQKQNCTKKVTNSYCYNGPRFDDVGQIKSCSVPGTVAITFDDGPTDNTAGIMDVLKQYNMKATFFLVGKNVFKYPDLVKRMVDEGHQIAAHTFTHPKLADITVDQFKQELEAFENSILQRNFNGVLSNWSIPAYFRAPFGAIDAEKIAVAGRYGYTTVHWGFLNGDSYYTDPADVVPVWQSHLGVAGEGVDASQLSVITQQHDKEVATAGSFPDLVAYLNRTFVSQGVKFVTVADCLGQMAPTYRPAPRRYEDPTCSTGIISSSVDGTVCCHSACGACGGNGCSSRTGGANACCVSNIVQQNIFCKYSRPPCIL